MIPCPLCGSEDARLRFPSTLSGGATREGALSCTNFGLGTHPDIWQCRNCDLVFNPPPGGSEASIEGYAEDRDPGYLEQRASRRATYARELGVIERTTEGRRLLDVGCHVGFFLELAAERGFDVEGVEPSRWASEYARGELGLQVFTGVVEQFQPSERFDVITLWDVIEHLENPVEVLGCIRGLLGAQGLLVFTTHKLDSRLARLLRGRYPFLMEMHTLHLTDETLPRLLARAGFEIVSRHEHRRALRVGYLAAGASRIHPWLGTSLSALSRLVGASNLHLWVRGVGLETVMARPAAS